MNRIASIALLLCTPVTADTIISMPPPVSAPASATPVMTMVDRAMRQSARTRSGLLALDRYAHARQAPYQGYNVDSGSYGAGWDWNDSFWYGVPGPRWGYSWGWWGWSGCIIVNVDAHSNGMHCGASVPTNR